MNNLTADKIDALPAGEQLDALVAEFVMGEPKPPAVDHELHLFFGPPIYSEKGNWYCQPEYDKGDVCIWKPMSFSADFGLFGKLIEQCQKRDFRFILDKHELDRSDGWVAGNWNCEIEISGLRNDAGKIVDYAHSAVADTGPLALSRVMLKTVLWIMKRAVQS